MQTDTLIRLAVKLHREAPVPQLERDGVCEDVVISWVVVWISERDIHHDAFDPWLIRIRNLHDGFPELLRRVSREASPGNYIAGIMIVWRHLMAADNVLFRRFIGAGERAVCNHHYQ